MHFADMPEIGKKLKTLVDGFALGHNKFFFTFTFRTGEQEHTYAMVPEDAKHFMLLLASGIAGYETFHGPIANPNEPEKSTPSPMDFNKPPSK